MAQAPRDANRIKAGLGVSNEDSTVTLPFYIDSITNRVLMKITSEINVVGTLPVVPALRDGNYIPAMVAVSSADGTTLKLPVMDNRNGNLYVDLLIE